MTGPRLTPDPGVRRWGSTIVGGSPLRVLRLSATGQRLVSAWFDGEPVGADEQQRRFADRLVAAGVAHPAYPAALTPADVTVVVPLRDGAERLPALRAAAGEVAQLLVVDDGSRQPVPGATIRHDVPRGPAAARNAGWRRATTAVVAFLDADVLPEPGWLAPLLAHLTDPAVALVAPRVRSAPGRSALARYEQRHSPLDLGDAPAEVRPGGRIGYLPSAALLARTDALREAGGFDERMRFGEDVDLVWRAIAGGRRARYEPASVVRHAPRPSWRRWLRQRFDYGTSAAPLARRHGDAVAPVRISPYSALAWLAAVTGHPGAGLAVAGATAALLPRKLAPSGVPVGASLALAARGHLGAGGLLADAVLRTWWPMALPLLARHRPGRRALAAAVAYRASGWRPGLDPVRWLTARLADDLGYGAGVWWGCLACRTLRPLLPALPNWPGRGGGR